MIKKASFLLIIGILIGVIAVGCGQQLKQEEVATQEEGLGGTKWSGGVSVQTAGTNKGTVSGKVLDAFTADPISGVTVFTDTKTSTTSATGEYTLSGVGEGVITVSAIKNGYNGMSIVSGAGTINFSLVKRYDFNTIKPTYPTGTVTGVILDQEGELITLTSTEDAEYLIYRYAYITLYSDTYGTSGFASVDNQGNYTIKNAPGGNITLSLQIYKSMYDKQSSSWESVSELGAFETGLSLSEGENLTVNLQITSEVATIEGMVTPPSSYEYNMNAYINAALAKEGFGLTVAYDDIVSEGSYSLTLPPNENIGYALMATSGGADDTTGVYGSMAFSYGIKAIANQIITKNFDLLAPPTLSNPVYKANDVDLTPTFSWSCGWQPDFYAMAVYEKISDWSNPAYFQWYVVLPSNVTSFKLPAGLLLPSKEYYWGIAAVKSPNGINNLDLRTMKINGASFAAGEFETAAVEGVLEYIVVSPSVATVEVGTTQQFTAEGYDSFGNSVTINPQWQVTSHSGFGSGTVIGTVDANGLFYPNKVGMSKIWAVSGDISSYATAEIYVVERKLGGLSTDMTTSEVMVLKGAPSEILSVEATYKRMKYSDFSVVYDDDPSSQDYHKIGAVIATASTFGGTEKGGIKVGDTYEDFLVYYGWGTADHAYGSIGGTRYEYHFIKGDMHTIFRFQIPINASPMLTSPITHIAILKSEWDNKLSLTENILFRWFESLESEQGPGASGVKIK